MVTNKTGLTVLRCSDIFPHQLRCSMFVLNKKNTQVITVIGRNIIIIILVISVVFPLVASLIFQSKVSVSTGEVLHIRMPPAKCQSELN